MSLRPLDRSFSLFLRESTHNTEETLQKLEFTVKIITPVTKLFDEKQSVHLRDLYFHAIEISTIGIGKMENQ